MLGLEQIFRPYRRTKIAVYGLSPLTETVLTQLSDHSIIGLLDGYRTEGELYGKPILSLENAIQHNVSLIIVAARPESCKVIAKRIESMCKKHKIALLDIYGKDLTAPRKAVYEFTDFQGVTKSQLTSLIDTYEVVSVDLFDTVIMRRTLFPTDVFELVELRLREKDIFIDGFSQKRLEAEKELGKSTVPTLFEIYSYLLTKCPVPDVEAEDLVRLEWETDLNLVVQRGELCELLQEIQKQGKEIYIVSDTFYNKKQLAELLEHCSVTWYQGILSSSDYRTSKTQNLFGILKEKLHGKTCLHIGDSFDADVKGAERSGLAACQLYSGLDLFEQAGYLGLWEQLGGLSSRIQAGMLVARLFNSPFQFEEPGRKIHVDSSYEIGYLFFAPLICDFVFWLHRRIQECGLKNVWFSARDGYLIQKLYNYLDNSTNSIYFLTSRTAAIRAGVENEADIRYVEEMRFSGSVQEQLWERFGISISNADKRTRLMEYKEEILKAAALDRERYHTYLQSLKTEPGDVAFFDFVARGTVQMYISRIAKRTLRGFYFLRQDEEYMQKYGLGIESFCGKGEAGEAGLEENYYILETVLTAPTPTVVTFDRSGKAIYGKESRTEQDLECIQEIQSGIIDYFQTYLGLCPQGDMSGNKQLGELLLALIHGIEVRDADFLRLKTEDPFFNRMTSIPDLL